MEQTERTAGKPTDPAAVATEAIIERFGGIRPMAAKTGIPVTTVQGWKKRGHIPSSRRDDILTAAASHQLTVTLDELDAATVNGGDGDLADGPDAEILLPETAERPQPSGSADELIAPAATEPAAPKPMAPEPLPTTAETPSEPDQPSLIQPSFASVPPVTPVTIDSVQPTSPHNSASTGTASTPLNAADSKVTNRRLVTALSVAWVALFLAGISLGMSGMQLLRTQTSPTASPEDALPGVTAELSDLRRKLDRMIEESQKRTNQPVIVERQSIPIPESTDSPLAGKLADLSNEVASLRSAVASLPLSEPGRIDVLDAKLQTLSESITELRNGAAGVASGTALAVAVQQLRTSVDTGRSFGRELAAIRALAADEPAVATAIGELVRASDQPLPDIDTLRRDFASRISAIIAASHTPADADWLDHVWAQLRSLITIRRIDPTKDAAVLTDDVDALVARAESALQRDDVVAADAALAQLTGAAAAAAAPWRALAAPRIAVDQAVHRLHDVAMIRLAGGR